MKKLPKSSMSYVFLTCIGAFMTHFRIEHDWNFWKLAVILVCAAILTVIVEALQE